MSNQYADIETGTNYNYFRDCYDPATGRYCQSDPIGLYGGQFSTYAYVNGNPLTGVDPYGLLNTSALPANPSAYVIHINPADMPLVPQGVVDYFSGYGSYYGGLFNGAKHIYNGSGLNGADAQKRAENAEVALALGIKTIATNPEIGKQAACMAEDWASNHKAYLAGRLTAGALLSGITGVGPYGGVSLGLFAGMGDALNNIENGMDNAQQIIPSIMGMGY